MSWLTRATTQQPEGRAVVDPLREQSVWTYEELRHRVRQLRARLAGRGLRPGDQVGLMAASPGVDVVALVHAALESGLVLVPLDPGLTTRERTHCLDTVELSLLVMGRCPPGPSSDDPAGIPVRSIDSPSDGPRRSLWKDRRGEPPEPAHERDDPAMIMFTSGTTSAPKGVVLTRGNLAASADASARRLGVDPRDLWISPLPIHHMGGMAPILRSARNGTAVLTATTELPRVLRVFSEWTITGISLVPTLLQDLIERVYRWQHNTLRFVLLGGAAAPPPLIEKCRQLGLPVFPTYGMTETASQITTATPPQAYRHPGTVGTPLASTQVRILDQSGSVVPPGEEGEITVAGPTVMKGYYRQPEINEEVFSRHGFHTGDIGRRSAAGFYYVLRRKDELIVTGGENVDPAEVREVLLDHPMVEEAVVVGLEDPRWGERVAAALVSGEDPPARDQIVSHCRAQLAPHKLPRRIRFLQSLPRTTSGTVDRDQVRQLLRSDCGD